METLPDVLPDFVLDELLKGREVDELKVLIEGKTKVVKEIEGCEGYVLVHSKDQITAHNAAKKDQLEGKGVLSNLTNCRVFQFLESIGLKTHFVRQYNAVDFIAERCAMIPLEWVTRRLATGSFLKLNPGVSEGFRFSPPKLGIHFKDDAAGDPLWSEEQALEAKLVTSGIEIGAGQLQLMSRVTLLVFEALERLWQELGVTLVDMKVEFGINGSGDIVLADVIDNDSWRLWPGGKKADMVDKQIYRDMDVVTAEKLKEMKHKFEWVQTTTQNFIGRKVNGRVVVLMGSPSDEGHANKIQTCLVEKFGIPTVIRLTSAHKNPRGTMSIIDDVHGC